MKDFTDNVDNEEMEFLKGSISGEYFGLDTHRWMKRHEIFASIQRDHSKSKQ